MAPTRFQLVKRSQLLLASLVGNPDLAVLVKNLNIEVPGHGDERLKENSEALTVCTATTDLRLCLPMSSSPMPSTFERAIAELGPQLKSLEISGGAWKSQNPEWLANLRCLKRLSMTHTYGYLDPRPSPPAFELERFAGSQNMTKPVEFSAVTFMLSSSHSSLLELDLSWSTFPTVFDLSAFTALKTFRLTSMFSSAEKAHAASTSLSALVKSFAVLEEFSLSAMMRFGPTPALEDVDILRSFPSTLKTLEFSFIPFKTAYLLDVLADLRCLPSLKSFDLYKVKSEGDGETRVPRPRHELNEITRVANERGIEIEWAWLKQNRPYGGG
ncbi:hypothetical protein BCR35DRAFT_334116 [Leucosporidium creatinivorum]|uniref:Proteophosphoglycan ppg4 n=1 Tax=Leucosporidium creatinivorum TaxID=106004 RepID=A0A1Y2ELR2_9BASI|nr:hypothetical protein BCR35DRAFT_334116 [Leucosporidium creatinivorum]